MLLQAVVALVLFVNPLAQAPAAVSVSVVPATQPAAGAATATTQPAMAAVTVAPSTQPVTLVLNADGTRDARSETIGEVFGRTRFGQLFRGEKKVTLDDVKDPLFWVDSVKDLILTVLGFIPRIIVALLFLVFFWMIYRAVRKLVLGSMGKANVDPSIRDMLGHLLKWAIMGFGLVIACNQIGVQIAALLTGVGIIGLAVGFAAQETLANFIAGIVIFWDKPFKVGDWLELDNTYGQVQRVTFRSTRILDLNGQVIIFPNTHMLANRVSNHTTHPLTRVAVPIGIAYKESIDRARQVMLATTKGDDRIAPQPPPEVVVADCAASSVDLLMRFWIHDEAREKKIVFEYIEKCKTALDAAQIQIPFPHVQLLLEETDAIHHLAGTNMRRAG